MKMNIQYTHMLSIGYFQYFMCNKCIATKYTLLYNPVSLYDSFNKISYPVRSRQLSYRMIISAYRCSCIWIHI